MVAMGDELKAYFPSLVHPVLRLFLQDKSPQRVATQKVSQKEGRGGEGSRGRYSPFFYLSCPDVEGPADVWSQPG